MKIQITLYSFLAFFLMSFVTASAQKQVRKNLRKGNKAYKEQKFSDASEFYQQAIEGNAKSMEANFNLGNVLYKQKQWDRSVEQMNHYLMLEKEDPGKMAAAWHNIGNALLQKKDLDKAIEAYKNALRFNPNDDETRYNLAVAKKIKEDQDKDGSNNQQQQDQQDQKQQDQKQQDQKQQDQKAEDNNAPEQMSQSTARQMLQAIEQDEKETQENVQQKKAQERQQKMQENRRQNKDW